MTTVQVRSSAVGRERPTLGRIDTTTFLTVFIALMVGIPSDLRVPGLGGAGSPAALWALGGALIWGIFRLQSPLPIVTPLAATRYAIWGLLAVTLACWTGAMLRPLPPFEANQADLGLIRMAAFCGLVLLTADGITGPHRLLATLRRFAWLVALLALLGLVQFYSGESLVDRLSLPGLVPSQDFAATTARGDFTRSAGTAMSPLEYAFVLVLAFPVALSLALFDTSRAWISRSLPAMLIGAALLVSVSRTGLVGLGLTLGILAVTWPSRIRKRMLIVAAIALVGLYLAVPGMVGTMRYLFLATDADPSAQSRAGGLDFAREFISTVPLLGRGFGTFLPLYRIFDNQYISLIIEIGLLGVSAFLLLLVFSAATCHVTARMIAARAAADESYTPTPLEWQLGHALCASTLSALVLTGLFDMFAFPMAAGCLSLVLGLCAAYTRLHRQPVRREADRRHSLDTGRRLLVYVAGVEWTGVQGTDRRLVQHLAGHVDVLWIDPPVSVLRTWRRPPGEGPRWGQSVTSVAPGVRRLSVVAPPLPSRPILRDVASARLRRSIRRAVRRDGRSPWAFICARPEPVLNALPEAVCVYYATDDFAAGSELLGLSARRLRWAERRQLETADLLVAVSPQITARWADADKATMVLPNGCDSSIFARRSEAVPADVGLASPVAGMIGQISARIDLALLEAVVDRGISLLLVGPRDPSFEPERLDALLARSLVRWTGEVPFDDLPRYLAVVDVGLTPYASTDFNRASFPLKTLEYLAAGIPVVSTPLPAVEWLGTELIRTAEGPGPYAAAVQEELSISTRENSQLTTTARRDFAAEHDWGRRAEALLSAIGVIAKTRGGGRAREPQAGRELKSS